ncbi:MAG: SRPBCC family protein [Gemmatimonadales bacterium]
MRSHTEAVTLSVSRETGFDFLSDPEALPLWAVGFCRSIRREGNRWLVGTAHGEMEIEFRTDRARGTIDFHMLPAPGVESVAYSRLVPNGSGAEYVFTFFQAPGMTDDLFQNQVTALGEELQVLKGVVKARAACA